MIRCNHCRTRRASVQLFTRHLAQHPECKPCTCGGYHFPHRRGSTYCDSHPLGPANQASRAGATPEEFASIVAELELERTCPF